MYKIKRIETFEKYDKIAGPGWELIDDKTKVNFNELTVSGKDVYQ